jgi:hypothetical protein
MFLSSFSSATCRSSRHQRYVSRASQHHQSQALRPRLQALRPRLGRINGTHVSNGFYDRMSLHAHLLCLSLSILISALCLYLHVCYPVLCSPVFSPAYSVTSVRPKPTVLPALSPTYRVTHKSPVSASCQLAAYNVTHKSQVSESSFLPARPESSANVHLHLHVQLLCIRAHKLVYIGASSFSAFAFARFATDRLFVKQDMQSFKTELIGVPSRSALADETLHVCQR